MSMRRNETLLKYLLVENLVDLAASYLCVKIHLNSADSYEIICEKMIRHCNMSCGYVDVHVEEVKTKKEFIFKSCLISDIRRSYEIRRYTQTMATLNAYYDYKMVDAKGTEVTLTMHEAKISPRLWLRYYCKEVKDYIEVNVVEATLLISNIFL